MAEAVEFERCERAGEELLAVRGEIDLATADEFRRALESLIAEAPSPALVDLWGVTFIDSSGVAALVSARGTAEAAGVELVLVEPSPQARTVLELTDLWTQFKTRP
jgi:anti-sigma B factor antagonist